MKDLRTQIESFDIDGGPSEFTFSNRLAKEQGWTQGYAERVIYEYKRFLYLGATQGPVSPSPVVDEAWHLHMIYTESYWTRLCGQVLGKPFHHHPTRGGQTERSKHDTMFEDTLAKYRRTFGEPPLDIWTKAPAPKKDEYWRISKSKVRIASKWAGAVGLGALAVGCTASVGSGLIPFLVLGVVGLVVLAIVAGVAANRRGQQGGTSGCSTGTGCSSGSRHGNSHGDGQGDGGSDGGGGDGGGSSCGGGCGGGGD